jgi:pimeloyl-ACP methyl ester carboxylesterase
VNRHSEFVTTDAVTIETYVDGTGPDVVILPSYGRDGGEDFDTFTAALADAGYRVLRPQPRGTGRSTGPMTGVTTDDLGADVARVIGELGHGPAVVLGHAYGNFVARTVATNHPEAVSAVILAAASGRTVAPEVDSAPFRAGDPALPEDERLAALRLAFFAPGHDPSGWLTGWHPDTLRMQQAAVTGIDVDRYWAAGNASVLEIIAALDPFKHQAEWGALRAEFGSRITTTIIENASHALFPEQPGAVARAVIDYLRGRSQKSG